MPPDAAWALRSASTAGKNPSARSICPSSSKGRGSRVTSGSTRMDTPGASRSRILTRPGIKEAAVASAIANTNECLASEAVKSPGPNDASSWRSASETAGHSANARGVGSTP